MRKQLIKKVLTTGLAAAMVLSMGAPAFAATINAGADSVTKTFNMASEGVTAPTATFTFTLARADASDTAAPLPTTTAYTLSASTMNKNAAVNAAESLFGTTAYTVKPGVYKYTVKETCNVTINNKEAKLTVDDSTYYLNVKFGTDGKVSGITASKTQNDQTDPDTSTSKVSSIAFTNSYAKLANSDGDEETGEDGTKGLEVKKTVDGTTDTSGTFTFQITFKQGSTANAALTTAVTTKGDVTTVYTDQNCTTAAASLTDSGTYYFQLTNGQNIFFQLPAGDTFTVTEVSPTSGYKTVSKTTANNKEDEEGTTSGTGVAADTVANHVYFTNTYTDSSVLTGIVNQYGGLLMIVVVAATGMIIVAVRRRRYEA